MASSANASFTSLLLLLFLLFIQIHARESNFFSKVPTNGDNFDAKDTQIPDKLDPALTKPQTTPPEQEPNFIPQTQNSGYGLYGHESGQLPPSDAKFTDPSATTGRRPYTTNYNNYRGDRPYKTESEEYYNNENFQTTNSKPYENSFYYNKDLYDTGRQNFDNTEPQNFDNTEPQNFDDTGRQNFDDPGRKNFDNTGRQNFRTARLSRDDYTTTPLYNEQKNDDDKKNNYYYNNNNGGNNENVERKGMSDTRFLENGKYYYDLNREPHHYSKSKNWINNDRSYSSNKYGYSNSMEGYQNDEAEFQDDEFIP